MTQISPKIQKLTERLNYQFNDTELLIRALTHSSAIAPSNRTRQSYQRLEFLGDRVLGLVVAEYLHLHHKSANEGELSRALNAVVRKESCAAVARQLNVPAALALGQSEARTGGAQKEAILGDVCEAIIGAIYLDGGLTPAKTFIEREFASFFKSSMSGRGDAKTTLQEWAQSRSLALPQYQELSREGPDHAPVFTIAVKLENHEPAQAVGKSKKIAEHEAATAFLVREGIWEQDDE
ncbi:ribonuclease-3 [Maritalea mobilis]|uniref:Ribonuclease 3 n=1 Tax=Maritalea mobilis TaxID=483324 RepID=A0A4R6VZQ1_9HYPH|nr:ribonuclease III [Maritalea mobilis]TDQ66125.1 ribonuclease-3 [Maritalea mobilis]